MFISFKIKKKNNTHNKTNYTMNYIILYSVLYRILKIIYYIIFLILYQIKLNVINIIQKFFEGHNFLSSQYLDLTIKITTKEQNKYVK